MSVPDAADIDHDPQRKGKGRATAEESTERSPLLGSSPPLVYDDDPPSDSSSQHRLRSLLLAVFLSTLFLCIICIVIFILLAYSYSSRVSDISPDDVLHRALVIQGPSRVRVLNATEGSMWLQVDGRIGVDTGALVGINDDPKDDFPGRIWKWFGRWGVCRLYNVTVNISTISISASGHWLASVGIPEMALPLTVNPPADLTWLTPVSLPLLFAPSRNATDLAAFVQESWRSGRVDVRANVNEVRVHGGVVGEQGWRRRLEYIRSDVETGVRMKIPELPGLPSPGKNTPFPDVSDFVTLQSFNISSQNQTVSIHAEATLRNPLPADLRFEAPSLPFIVSLPNITEAAVPIAIVHSQPFSLSHPNTTIILDGSVLPIPRHATSLLSAFVSSYLSALSPPIVIGTPLLPTLAIPALFPAPATRPQLLRDVAIRNMRIRPGGATVYASGTVFARVVLPRGVRVGLAVERIWPDVLVFDGAVPPDVDPLARGAPGARAWGAPDGRPPLPDPLPPGAFARIRPDDWLPAQSAPRAPSEAGGGAEYTVTAVVDDVPLEVLPGRDKEFRAFVAKVIFGTHGALAGIQGVAAVAASVDGLPVVGGDGSGDGRSGVMELSGLPFQGSFRVGKKGF